jgi:chorismate dehydratase
MNPVRLGAVSYLNTKPLVAGLAARTDLFTIRFDVPARCAELLHEGSVDVGLIPAIEYRREYRIVPGVAIGSDGPIASVAIFSRVPVSEIRSLALDENSRTSATLVRILCARRWSIAPRFTVTQPDLQTALDGADAVLVIGDAALMIDPVQHGVIKTDLGAEWRALTGLPFVFAVWAGRDGVLGPEHVGELQAARNRGVGALECIAAAFGEQDRARVDRALSYLRDNLKYGLGSAERAGLSRFLELATEHGLLAGVPPLRFYD